VSEEAPGAKALGDLLVRHGDRLWEAEREVADRHADRVRVLVTLASTLVGGQVVALLKVLSDVTDAGLGAVLATIASLVLAAPVAFAAWKMLETLIFLLYSMRPPVEAADLHREDRKKAAGSDPGRPPDTPPTASYELDLPEEFLEWAMEHSSEPEAIVFSQIAHAAGELRRRNLRERYRILAAERAFAWGLRATLVFVLAFVGCLVILSW